MNNTSRNLIWCAIIFLLMIVESQLALTSPQVEKEQALSSCGTLVLTVPTKEGLVVCADKRRYNEIQGATDDEVKVFRLGKGAGFAVSGARAILSRTDFSKLFDATDVVVKYFADKDISNGIEKYWDELQVTIKQEYLKYRAAGGPDWEAPVLLPDYRLYVLIFFYLDEANRIQVMKVEFRYKKEPPTLLDVVRYRTTEVSLKSAQAEGQGEVVGEIIRGQDARFSDLRSNHLIKRFKAGENPATISVNDALKFAKKLVQATNERNHLISNIPTLVSQNSDCAIMSYKEGFKWL